MSKNLCSGCSLNFGTMETFEAHRIGKFGVDRRCMSIAEMKLKGWEYSEPLLTFFNDGQRFKRATPTWTDTVAQERKKRSFEPRIFYTVAETEEKGNVA